MDVKSVRNIASAKCKGVLLLTLLVYYFDKGKSVFMHYLVMKVSE